MRIIQNPGKVARRAHSVRAWALAIFFGFAGVLGDMWQAFDGVLPLSPAAFAILGLVFGMLGLIGRFIDQDL